MLIFWNLAIEFDKFSQSAIIPLFTLISIFVDKNIEALFASRSSPTGLFCLTIFFLLLFFNVNLILPCSRKAGANDGVLIDKGLWYNKFAKNAEYFL